MPNELIQKFSKHFSQEAAEISEEILGQVLEVIQK